MAGESDDESEGEVQAESEVAAEGVLEADGVGVGGVAVGVEFQEAVEGRGHFEGWCEWGGGEIHGWEMDIGVDAQWVYYCTVMHYSMTSQAIG